MSTSLSSDISIIFVCHLVFISIFVLILFVVCISTSGIIANLSLIFDLCCYANFFIRVRISKHGCTSIGTSLCINALVLIRVLASLTEGSCVFVEAVSGRQALIQEPLKGWVVLEKRSGPVFRQESYQQLKPGEKRTFESIVDNVLMRLSQDAPIEAAADLTREVQSLPEAADDLEAASSIEHA